MLFKLDISTGLTFLPVVDWEQVAVISDNFETEVIFIVAGYQYISSAMAFNFGYEFREGWWKNRIFVVAVFVFSFFHFYVTLVPGYISCFWRINCDNEHTVIGVTSFVPMPIQNPYHTTVMPVNFRWTLVAVMIANTMAIMGYEYVLNGYRRRFARPGSSVLPASFSLGAFDQIPAHEGVAV